LHVHDAVAVKVHDHVHACVHVRHDRVIIATKLVAL
jgi:hypothetical protein